VGWLLLGSLLALPGDVLAQRVEPARGLAALPLVLLALGMARVPGVLQHGGALAELSSQGASALGRALEGAPDSSFALALEARTRSELHSWDPVLELRPHSIEALNNSAVRHARAGELGVAIERWMRVLELDPGHDGALSYLAQHELERGNDAAGLDALARLRASGRLREGAAELLAASTTLSGNLSGAVAVLASEDPAGAAPSAYALDARAEELQSEAGAAMPAAGLGALAHWLWGREHAEAGNFDDARRSYYRAWRVAQGAGAKPIALGLELSAAYLQDDKPDESRALYDELAPVELAEHPGLPGWAHEALLVAAYR